MKTTKTADGIRMTIVAGDVCDGNGVVQYRGALSKDAAEHSERAAALFAAIPSLTYAQIPGAVKRLRAGKTAIDERAAKVAEYRASVSAGGQPEQPMVGITQSRREHMAICRSLSCRLCRQWHGICK